MVRRGFILEDTQGYKEDHPDIFEGISQHMPRRIQYMRYRENEGAKVALENRKGEKKPIYLV